TSRCEPPSKLAPNDSIVDFNRTGDRAIFSERHLPSGYVAFHRPIDMDLALADDVAFDGEIIAKDRRDGVAACTLFSRLLGPHCCSPLSAAFFGPRLCRTNLSAP